MGIWGAIVGGLTYLYFYAKYKKLNYWHLSDSITLGSPVAQAIGRVGNFINGELYGKNGEPLFAWEGGLNILLFVALMYVSGFRITCPQLLKHSFCRRESGMTRRTDSNGYKINDGVITGSYLVGYGVIRIFLENFRPNDIIWRLAGVPVAIWFGAVAIITGLGIIIFQKK